MNNIFEAYSPTKKRELFDIYCLYQKAFPASEKKPFGIILQRVKSGMTEILYCKSGGRFVGFSATMVCENAVLLDYLAVRKKERGKSFGSQILSALKEQYRGKGIIVEIEDTHHEGSDKTMRQKRREFYLRNGFHPTGIEITLFGVDMEILCTSPTLTKEQLWEIYCIHYKDLADKFVQIKNYT